ncbi:hypothetical protein GOV08_01845, partial [Candidatus Woesearchaeota archaeon]|nr:hypothetical protein [Candidatus Woesearchaeota archaeon]
MELEDFPEDWLWSDINKKQYCDLIEEKIDEAFPENNRGKRKLMRKLEKFKKITNREKASKYVKRLIKMIDESSIDDKVDEGRRDFLKTGLKAAGVGLGLGLGLKQGKGNTDALYDKDGKLINSADFGGSTAVKTDGTPVTMYKEGYGFGPNGEFYLRGANGGVEQAKTAADYIKAAEQIKDVNEKIKIYDNARKG